MSGETEFLELFGKDSLRPSNSARQAKEQPAEEDEESCPAFGFLRGVRDRALAVEFRLRSGEREWYPYSWLGPWRYNPSAGLLLKFTGDTVTLVLIRGSNLDLQVNQSGLNLIDRGLQRHRITWIREMDEEELQKAKEAGPTIDRIDIVEFESSEEAKEYLKKMAPAFAR